MADVPGAALQGGGVAIDNDLRDAIALYEQYVQLSRTAIGPNTGARSLPLFFAPIPVPIAMSLVES